MTIVISPADESADTAPFERLRRHCTERPHPAALHEDADWFADYLEILVDGLRSVGLGDAELAPLREIAAEKSARACGDEDRMLDYAAAAAEITVLILTGADEGSAARHVARRLIARGVPLPDWGGDARGWKNLLIIRDRFRHHRAPADAVAAYEAELARLKAQAA